MPNVEQTTQVKRVVNTAYSSPTELSQENEVVTETQQEASGSSSYGKSLLYVLINL